MPKRRSSITTGERYKAKAFAIAKALGLPDDMAKSKAERQYIAWSAGRAPYASISKKIRIELLNYKNIPTTLYGTIIACANWVYKVSVNDRIMGIEDAVNDAVAKFGLDKALSDVQLATVKDIIKIVVATV